MAITETDLIFLESERLDDSDSGGGRMTGNVIPDGQENNLFPDVAPTDRVFGRVRLRKIFAANHSNSTDLYLGAHVIVSHPPTDANINVTLFSTGDWVDVREDARDYIERYLARSGYWPCHLYGDHLEGQRALQLVQFPNTEAPVVGQTLSLIQDEGEANEQEQYVRITRVSSAMQTFVDGNGSFERLVVLAEISDPLRYDFEGEEPSRYTNITPATRVRDTIASAAARYYGVTTLTAIAEATDREITISSLFTPLVPNVQTETPILDAQAGGGKSFDLSGGSRITTIAQVAHTNSLLISAINQTLNYTALLLPKPAIGTVVASYRAQGKWYTLTDNGVGGMTGAGAGTIHYSTGSVLITLSALPDIGSSILWGWGASVHTAAANLTTAQVTLPAWDVQLQQKPIEKNSISITWMSGGLLRTAIDQEGVITGDGKGRVDYANGRLTFLPLLLPEPGTSPAIAYRSVAQVTETFTPIKDNDGFVTITVAQPPINAGSIKVEFDVTRTKTESDQIAG